MQMMIIMMTVGDVGGGDEGEEKDDNFDCKIINEFLRRTSRYKDCKESKLTEWEGFSLIFEGSAFDSQPLIDYHD